MTKIAITHDLGLSAEDLNRLNALGEVVVHDSRPDSAEDWLKRTEGADVICSGISGLKDSYQHLENVFISLPMVGYSYLDKEVLEKNNITVSNSPGCNMDAVAEWVTGMIVNLYHDMMFFIGNDNLPQGKMPPLSRGLVDQNVLIIGKGNIGTRVGEICEALKMNVSYFRRGDDLLDKTQGQDVLVNCLGVDASSMNILDASFFESIKEGAFFISISNNKVYDIEAMFKALESGKIAKIAIDEGTMPAGKTDDPYYQRLIKHPNIIATPHIAFHTDYTDKLGNKIMIDNIEAYLNDKPIHLAYS